MRTILLLGKITGVIALVITICLGAATASDIQKMSPSQLKSKLDQEGVYIFDARIASDWKNSDRKISGAIRIDPHNVSAWIDKYPKDGVYVIYCA